MRVVGHLWRNWDERVELYNINIPMREDVESQPVLYTRTLPYYWSRGCLYAEVGGKKEVEKEKMNGFLNGVSNGDGHGHVNDLHEANGVNGVHENNVSKQRLFKWSADLSDMKKRLQESEEGTDAHTVLNGSTRYVSSPLSVWCFGY